LLCNNESQWASSCQAELQLDIPFDSRQDPLMTLCYVAFKVLKKHVLTN